jgi:hypothetical protein
VFLRASHRFLLALAHVLVFLHGELEVRGVIPFAESEPQERVPSGGFIDDSQDEVPGGVDDGLDGGGDRGVVG